MKRQKKKIHKIYVTGMIVSAVILCIVLVTILLVLLGVVPVGRSLDQESFVDQVEMLQSDPEQLSPGLELQSVGRYDGLYLEDGSNDPVADVIMIKIKNISDQDLQLARLNLIYSGFTAEFEISNLPAGRTVIVLEKNRYTYTDQQYLSFTLADVVYFEQPMDVPAQIYEITGMHGAFNLKNCSDSDIVGDIYIYYKYVADDQLYGGITYRAKIAGGLRAGEIKQVSSAHFDPNQCMILNVFAGE